MKWPSAYAEAQFRALFPQYPNACPHLALDLLVDAVRAYQQRDAELRRQLEAAMQRPNGGLSDDWTRGT